VKEYIANEKSVFNFFLPKLKNSPLTSFLGNHQKEIEELALNINRMYNISMEDFVIEMDPITLHCNYKMRDDALRTLIKKRLMTHIESKPLAILPMRKASCGEDDNAQFFFSNGKFENTFSVVDCIGQGSFGMVFKAEHALEKVAYAIKMVLFNGVGADEFVRILNEVRAMARLNHRNIVNYFTCWFEDASQSFIKNMTESLNEDGDFTIQSNLSNDFSAQSVQSLKPQAAMFIQMEHCEGGSLADWLIKKRDRLHRIEAFSLFDDIRKGLTEIHKANIIHRDLKSTNQTGQHPAQ
jgi:serine/threonine protein kinase